MSVIGILGAASPAAKASHGTPAPQTTQTTRTTQTTTSGGFMDLLTQYWYIPAGLIAVLAAIGLAKRKSA